MTEYIYLRARVITRQDKCLTVRLDDGFANAEAQVHIDNALPESAVTAVIE